MSMRTLVRAGDPDAFGELYEQHARAVYNHAFWITADWSVAEDVAPDIADEAVSRLDDAERLSAVHAALAKLRRMERDVLALCVWSGLDYAAALGQRERRDEKARRPWPLRTAFLVPALTAALALPAVTVALPVVRHHLSMSSTESQPGVNAPVIAVQPGSTKGVAVLMDRIATVAASQPAVEVRTNQFVYVKSEIAFAQETIAQSFTGPWKMDRLHQREVWLPQDLTRPGLIRENSQDITLQPAPGQPGIYNPTYQWLASLPTDPAALLKKIYADTLGHGAGPDDEAFDMIGELLRESIMPPKVNAALYRAAAKIPGVAVVPDSVDAAGRHGVGIARVDATGERDEWIFDKKSLTYLGERDYLARDTSNGKAGMLVGTTAVLARGVADQTGQTAVRTS